MRRLFQSDNVKGIDGVGNALRVNDHHDLRVQRDDEKSGISWDELQRLKDEHLGPDVLAVEIYPPAHRVVNELNMRHLWEVPQDVLPIGLK